MGYVRLSKHVKVQDQRRLMGTKLNGLRKVWQHVKVQDDQARLMGTWLHGESKDFETCPGERWLGRIKGHHIKWVEEKFGIKLKCIIITQKVCKCIKGVRWKHLDCIKYSYWKSWWNFDLGEDKKYIFITGNKGRHTIIRDYSDTWESMTAAIHDLAF